MQEVRNQINKFISNQVIEYVDFEGIKITKIDINKVIDQLITNSKQQNKLQQLINISKVLNNKRSTLIQQKAYDFFVEKLQQIADQKKQDKKDQDDAERKAEYERVHLIKISESGLSMYWHLFKQVFSLGKDNNNFLIRMEPLNEQKLQENVEILCKYLGNSLQNKNLNNPIQYRFKLNVSIKLHTVKEIPGNVDEHRTIYSNFLIKGKSYIQINSEEIEQIKIQIIQQFVYMGERLENSRCAIKKATFRVRQFFFVPQNVGSYIALCQQILNKKICLNIQNMKDDYCVIYTYMLSCYIECQQRKIKELEILYKNDQKLLKQMLKDIQVSFKNHERANLYIFDVEKINENHYNIYIDGIQITKTEYFEINKQLKNIKITFPTSTSDIQNFYEKIGCNVNIFMIDQTKKLQTNILVNYRSLQNKERHNILLLQSEDQQNYHTVAIKNINSLLDLNKSDNLTSKYYYCENCQKDFSRKEIMESHYEKCISHDPDARIDIYPTDKQKILKFSNGKKQVDSPFLIFYDIESILPKFVKQADIKNELQQEIAKTEKTNTHIPASIKLFLWCIDSKYNQEFMYHGQDCIKLFIEKLIELNQFIGDTIKQKADQAKIQMLNKEIYNKMTQQQKNEYYNAQTCYICDEAFAIKQKPIQNYTDDDFIENFIGDDNGEDYFPDEEQEMQDYQEFLKKDEKKIEKKKTDPNIKVLDHCHFKQEYRGAAHLGCNLAYYIQTKQKVPTIAHNSRSYDSHCIIQEIAKLQDICHKDSGNFKCIPQNNQKFITFSFYRFQFIDSCSFMMESLSNLANNLEFQQKQTTINGLRKIKSDLTEKQINKICRKGIFPYSWFDSMDKLTETQLPPIECFFNELSKQACSPKNYKYALQIFKLFDMKTFKQYHDLYLDLDVWLLADIYLNFRNICQTSYKLSCDNYITAPSLSWDAMMKMSKISIQLIQDPDIYQMFEQQKRGGVSQAFQQHGKANNQYCQDYDQTKETEFLTYVDANNLYGGVMQKMPYPIADYRFLSQAEIDEFTIDEINDHQTNQIDEIMKYDIHTNSTGYMFEVDLEYPNELHNKHQYPLAVQSLKLNKINKLVANLNNKYNYKCNIYNLQKYLKWGMKLIKIHRIISYTQDKFLSKFIDLNSTLRKAAKNDFEKNFFKLMNNSVFGKTMEDVKNRKNYNVCDNSSWSKHIGNVNFKNAISISDNLHIIEKYQQKNNLNKPFQIGMQVLEFSKICMYEFLYDFIDKKYPNQWELIYTDTDSLILRIKTENLFKDMLIDADQYDFNEYKEQCEIIPQLKQHCIEQKIDYEQIPKILKQTEKHPIKKYIKKYCDEKNIDYSKFDLKYQELEHPIIPLMKQHCTENNIDYQQFKNQNKKVVLKMKDECSSSVMREVVALQAKCYSYQTEYEYSQNKCHNKGKGVKQSELSKFTINDYKNVQQNGVVMEVQQNTFQSKNHQIYSVSQTKKALSNHNDKAIYCESLEKFVPIGHYLLRNE